MRPNGRARFVVAELTRGAAKQNAVNRAFSFHRCEVARDDRVGPRGVDVSHEALGEPNGSLDSPDASDASPLFTRLDSSCYSRSPTVDAPLSYLKMRYRAWSISGLLAGLLLACGGAEVPDPGEWPQFRGLQGNGVSAQQGLPLVWSEESENLAWKVAIPGTGNSSPIVSHGRVFLTTATDAGQQVERWVVALDLDTGAQLWQTSIGPTGKSKRHRYNTYAAPTPATDGRLIFAHFGDRLACLDIDGQILWTKELDEQYAEYAHYGSASSPVLTATAVIVAHDRETTEKPNGWLGAFDKRSGDELWKVEWTDTCCSYTTPLVRRRGASEEVIFTGAGAVTSYDAVTGEQLWSHNLQINQPVASAVTDGDFLAVFSGAHNVRFGAVLKLVGEGKETQTEELWQTNQMIPQTASPVLYDGKLFTVVELGHMVCYDLLTGTRLWRRRLPKAGAYRSSLVAGDGKIYALTSSGITVVIAAEHEFQQLATNPLAEGGNASPALADSSILIRTATTLYRFRGEGGEADA